VGPRCEARTPGRSGRGHPDRPGCRGPSPAAFASLRRLNPYPCRFSRSFFDVPLSCLAWFLPSSVARVRPYWFDRPSPPLFRAESTGVLRFSTRSLDVRYLFDLRLQPSAAPQRRATSLRDRFPGRSSHRFAPVLRCAAHPTEVGCWSTFPRLPSFVAPLAASSLEFGHPGFTPPASSAHGFSQTSDGLHLQSTCLFYFTQAPPMGFKEHEWFVASLAVLTGPSEDSPARDHEARTRPSPGGRRTRNCCLLVANDSVSAEKMKLSPRTFVGMSLTRFPASSPSGRRALRTCPVLLLQIPRVSPALSASESLTRISASRQTGRRTLRPVRVHLRDPREHRPPQPAPTAPLPEQQPQPAIPKHSVLHRSFTPRPVPRFAAITTLPLGLSTSPPDHRALCATPLQYGTKCEMTVRKLSRRTTAPL
jgi:hypothetical protein